jgi:hypothetical protein
METPLFCSKEQIRPACPKSRIWGMFFSFEQKKEIAGLGLGTQAAVKKGERMSD